MKKLIAKIKKKSLSITQIFLVSFTTLLGIAFVGLSIYAIANVLITIFDGKFL